MRTALPHSLVSAAAALALLAAPAMAQTHYDGNIAVGAKVGATLSRQQFNPTVPQTMLPGITMGATFRYMEERHFGVIAELNMEQRGWKETFDDYDYAYQRRLTYVQLPVLTHIYFGSSRVHGFFNAGPEMGLLIGESVSANFDYANVKAVADFPSTNRNTDQFALDAHSRFDYGIAAGAGLEVLTRGRSSFTLEGRFYYGLGDLFRNRKRDTFSSSSSMSVMVTLGWMYRVK